MTGHITLPRIDYSVVQAYCDANKVSYNEACAMVRAALAGAAQAEPVATYMGHRLTPDGTKEFWGLADTPLSKGTKLYTTPQPTQPVAVPQEYKLVPVEPTHEMRDAGCPAGEFVDHFDIATAYRAMLTAAPTPPAATVPVLEPLTRDEIVRIAMETGLQSSEEHWGTVYRAVGPSNLESFAAAIVEAAHAAKLEKRGGV